MEQNKLLYDLDGSAAPKYTENEQPTKRKSSKNDVKRRRFYKTSGMCFKTILNVTSSRQNCRALLSRINASLKMRWPNISYRILCVLWKAFEISSQEASLRFHWHFSVEYTYGFSA